MGTPEEPRNPKEGESVVWQRCEAHVELDGAAEFLNLAIHRGHLRFGLLKGKSLWHGGTFVAHKRKPGIAQYPVA